MGQGNQRLLDGTRSKLDVRADSSVWAFSNRPAIVAARLDSIDHFPLFPAHVADPKIPGRPIETHPPRVAQAKRIDFRTRARNSQKWVISGNGVRICALVVIDIE